MNAEINYKKKYLELRAKYIGDLDMAFRLGVEQGMQTAQQQQAVEAQAKAEQMQMKQQQMAMQAQNGGEEGGPPKPNKPGETPDSEGPDMGEPSTPESGMGDIQAQQRSSELDQHIGKLEGMLGSNSDPEVKKSLDAILNLRKAEKLAMDMKKSEEAIKGIAKALHKPAFKVGVQANHNLSSNAKEAVSMQHKIVNDIMKSWAAEESRAEKDIKNILNVENLLGE